MSKYSHAEEADLVRRIADRDQSALLELYRQHYNLVYGMALRVLRQTGWAEEVTQDVFFQVWRWPEKWDPEKGHFSSWVLSVTRYTAIDRLRREHRQPTLAQRPLEDLSHLLPQSSDEDQREDGRLLRRIVARLPREQRQIIYLAYFRGMTHSEIADYLNLPLGTVKSRLRLGLEKLKAAWLKAVEEVRPE